MDNTSKEIIQITGHQIKAYTPEQAREQISKVLDFVAVDLGLTPVNGERLTSYDKARFTQYIAKYFKYLTIVDIKLMFELYTVGKLELPDTVKPYRGEFPASFYVEVIKAYVNLKNKAKQEHTLALPEPEITEEKKAKIFKEFEQKMVSDFDKFKDTGEVNNRMFNLTVHEYWHSKGELTAPEITRQDENVALMELLADAEGKLYASEITEERKQKKAKLLSHYRQVRSLYEFWIETGDDIRNYIKSNN